MFIGEEVLSRLRKAVSRPLSVVAAIVIVLSSTLSVRPSKPGNDGEGVVRRLRTRVSTRAYYLIR
jgi:hypothetical protein